MLTPWFLAARYLGQGVAKVFSSVSDRVNAVADAHTERAVARMSECERQDYYIRDAEQRRARRRQEEATEARWRGCLVVFVIVLALPVLFIVIYTTNSRSEQRRQEQAKNSSVRLWRMSSKPDSIELSFLPSNIQNAQLKRRTAAQTFINKQSTCAPAWANLCQTGQGRRPSAMLRPG